MIDTKLMTKLFLSLCWLLCLSPTSSFADKLSPQAIAMIQHETLTQMKNENMQQWIRLLQRYQKEDKANRFTSKRRHALMVLVSFSMPKQSLQSYLIASQKIKASLVLRGFIENSLTATVTKIHDLIQDSTGGFQVDPIIYEKLHITKVPTIILMNDTALRCFNRDTCSLNPKDVDIISGNVSLDYALTQFSQKGSAAPNIAKTLLQKLRGQDA